MIQKLYSPVFCNMETPEDYDYNRRTLSQSEAAEYAGKINDFIKELELPDEEERGLMEYFYGNTSVDEKVASLFINVEVIDGKLWGVSTIDVTEPLDLDEIEDLKDYITGQMSDGFGESLEQREIRTDEGSLYVSLWESGSAFYIDTAQEFQNRLGIELPEVINDLRAQLIERIDKNIANFENSDRFHETILSDAAENAHYIISHYGNYTSADLHNLLAFEDPLDVVAFYVRGKTPAVSDMSDVLTYVNDNLDWLKANYAAADKTSDIAELRTQLVDRASENWENYRHAPHNTAPDNLFNASVEVINRRNAYVFISEHQGFTAEQLDCLLQFANPVEVVADYLDPMSEASDLSGILESIVEKQEYYKQHYALADKNEALAADAPVADEASVKMRTMLTDRIEDEYEKYYNDLLGLDNIEIESKALYTKAVDTAYKYFTEYKDGTGYDLEFLLDMSNPLAVFAEQIQEMSEENLSFEVILDFLKDNYDDMSAEKYTEAKIDQMQELLDARVEQNYKDYCDSLRGLSPSEIMDLSSTIYNTKEAYDSLKSDGYFDGEQLEFLLRLDDPLEIFADQWARESAPIHLYQVTEMVFGDTSRVEDFYKLSDTPFVAEKPIAAETPDKSTGGTSKAERFFTGVAERWEEYIENNPIPAATEKPDKTADKPLTGMAKLRKAEKDKTKKSEKPAPKKSKSMRKHKGGRG